MSGKYETRIVVDLDYGRDPEISDIVWKSMIRAFSGMPSSNHGIRYASRTIPQFLTEDTGTVAKRKLRYVGISGLLSVEDAMILKRLGFKVLSK